MDDTNSQRTVWCGNLSERITEEVLYELFLQAAPLERVHIPKDKNGKYCNYGFVTFKHLCSVSYAISLLNGISLYNKKINIKPRHRNTDTLKTSQAYNVTTSTPALIVQNDICKFPEPLENIRLLTELGNQFLLTNNRHFPQDYRNDRMPNNARGHSNYYKDRRDDARFYRRHNYHDRYSSNGRPYERNRDRY